MSHSLSNLEHHHFKYALFRRPGDIHVHFFGTATPSFSEGVRTEEGDVFEIQAPPFTLPRRSRLTRAAGVPVKALCVCVVIPAEAGMTGGRGGGVGAFERSLCRSPLAIHARLN